MAATVRMTPIYQTSMTIGSRRFRKQRTASDSNPSHFRHCPTTIFDTTSNLIRNKHVNESNNSLTVKFLNLMYRVQPVDNDCCIELFDFRISEYFTLFLNAPMKITYYSSDTPNDFPSVPAPPVISSFLFHSFFLLSILPTLRFFIYVLRKKFFEKLMLSWQSVILSKIKLYRSE